MLVKYAYFAVIVLVVLGMNRYAKKYKQKNGSIPASLRVTFVLIAFLLIAIGLIVTNISKPQ